MRMSGLLFVRILRIGKRLQSIKMTGTGSISNYVRDTESEDVFKLKDLRFPPSKHLDKRSLLPRWFGRWDKMKSYFLSRRKPKEKNDVK
jgi:hypothetical protein